MPKFIPGLDLSRFFYQKEVRPILNQEFPKLRHSAALIGWGSEVLSFDTCLSRDHHWGPRVLLFLSDRDYAKLKEKIGQALSDNLPYEFMGYSTNFGKLQEIRAKLKFFPRDVWLYLLAAQWTRISQEEAFVGRAGDVGDELGSQIVASRLVREIMKLVFLMERQYAPYSKWFGSAFSKLKIGADFTPILRQVLLAKTWKARE